MKLKYLPIALALLVPATASAGPIEPSAALSNEVADLSPAYDAPVTGSESLAYAAAVTSSPFVYETSFTISMSRYTPPSTPPGDQQQPQPVPEPSTLLLVGSSMAFAAVRKARANRKQTANVQ